MEHTYSVDVERTPHKQQGRKGKNEIDDVDFGMCFYINVQF